MDDIKYHEDQRSITQGSFAPQDTQVGFPNPGSTNMHNQVSNNAVERVSYQFEDFVTPNPGSSVWVKGTRASLNSLDLTVNCGGRVQRIVGADQEFAAYTPFVTSINFVCARHGLKPITERDLILLQGQPWFEAFLKQFVNRHRAENTIDYSKLGDVNLPTSDRMVLLLEALEFSGRLPKIVLGVVVHDNNSPPWVIHYPCVVPQSHLTAWVLVEPSSAGSRYYGFENAAAQQQAQNFLQLGFQQQPIDVQQRRLLLAPQPLPNAQPLPLIFQKESDDEIEEDNADAEDEAIETPKTTLRKTAARVLAQQVPLPAGMSVGEIIEKHPERVHYNNMLKVALKLSNKTIAGLLAKHGLTLASGVVKRINTALEFVESEFDIDEDAFRTAFDRERKAADIPTRGKEEVSDEILNANASKIAVAMAWVKTGGPRPAPTGVAPVETIGQGIAPHPIIDAAPSTGPYAAPTADSDAITTAGPYAAPLAGPYSAPIAGPSIPPVARGYAPGSAADGLIVTSSLNYVPTMYDGSPGYAPASHPPIHMQHSNEATHGSDPDDVFYDNDAVSSDPHDFQGSANTPSPNQSLQMDVDGGNMNDNDNDTIMDGDDGIDWGNFMKELPPNFFD